MTQTDYEHELTTVVPHDFPEQLVEDIQAADGDDRILIDLEETNLRVALADDDAVRWLVRWLNDRPDDGAQGLADVIESTFRGVDDGE